MRKKQQIRKLQSDVEILKVRLAALETRPGAAAPPPFPAGPPGMPADFYQSPTLGVADQDLARVFGSVANGAPYG